MHALPSEGKILQNKNKMSRMEIRRALQCVVAASLPRQMAA
jgi:hypothetical protein